ncbi:unnamed protein product [Brachionus calyciflorus]|uniref:THO complex subunit 7 n=1 Tax=Brachionus calyciflorus TaxID=104777 RepID=A0A813UEM1_9BILA|nr:unnamed protein product [Brachionus calyciflorus]
MMSSEDDIIKKRLLIEGDSGTEDRLINKIIKNFVKWTNSFYLSVENANLNEEESMENLYEQLVVNLAHVEFGLLRNQFIVEMNKSEHENYHLLYEKISNEIEKAKKKIIENKAELVEARGIRKNRQEYDVLARQILNYPDRTEMQNTIKNLESKVESLKKAESEYDRKIDLRRKQFSVVLQSLSSLKNLIENDTNFDDYLNQVNMNEEGTPLVEMSSQSKIKIDSEPEKTDVLSPSNGKDNNEEMEDDTNDENRIKRDKYSVPEVEMEES